MARPEADAHLVSEFGWELEARTRAAQFIGAALMGRVVEYEEQALVVAPIESLYDAVQKAAEGDTQALELVKTNARTDVVERTIKAGHVSQEVLNVDAAGRIQQSGQSLESIQANSLRFAANSPQMEARTRAEARNTFRTYFALEAGALQEYSLLVISRAADDMSDEAMAEVGFFTDTMSCSLQLTSLKGDQLSLETAMVAGRVSPKAERHDAASVTKLVEKLTGQDVDGKSATQILDMPILVPNGLIKNGVIDIVKLYDEAAGGTFFGQNKQAQDYVKYLELCREREATLASKVDLITDELIAAAPQLNSRLDAVKMLNKISGKHMVQQAIFDTEIDPAVFGKESADHIWAARRQWELGDYDRALESVGKAVKADRSSSCPSSMNSESGNNTESDSGDCSFVSKTCPKCGSKNVLTTVKKIGSLKKISGTCGCTKYVSK